MSRQALLLTLVLAIALLGLSLIVGFRDYDQAIVVAPDPITTPSGAVLPGPGAAQAMTVHCPGPLASIADIGAYYPVGGHIVSPRLGAQPMPCLVQRGRRQLEVWLGIGVSLAIGLGAAVSLWRRSRHPSPDPPDQSPVEAEPATG